MICYHLSARSLSFAFPRPTYLQSNHRHKLCQAPVFSCLSLLGLLLLTYNQSNHRRPTCQAPTCHLTVATLATFLADPSNLTTLPTPVKPRLDLLWRRAATINTIYNQVPKAFFTNLPTSQNGYTITQAVASTIVSAKASPFRLFIAIFSSC